MHYPGELINKLSQNEDAVIAIKKQLNALGYPKLDDNNPNFGDVTEKVVKMFQEANQLVSDGVVGRLSWDRMFSPRVNVPVQSRVLRIRALEIMNTQLFVREKTGKNDGADVKKYLNDVGLGEGYAWCMAAVYWCFDEAANQLGIKNPLPRTGGVLECLRRAKGMVEAMIIYDKAQFQKGDQFIMDFGGGKGHTGLVEAPMLNNVYTIEGNTNGEGSRDGDGMYERSRTKSSILCVIRWQ